MGVFVICHLTTPLYLLAVVLSSPLSSFSSSHLFCRSPLIPIPPHPPISLFAIFSFPTDASYILPCTDIYLPYGSLYAQKNLQYTHTERYCVFMLLYNTYSLKHNHIGRAPLLCNSSNELFCPWPAVTHELSVKSSPQPPFSSNPSSHTPASLCPSFSFFPLSLFRTDLTSNCLFTSSVSV